MEIDARFRVSTVVVGLITVERTIFLPALSGVLVVKGDAWQKKKKRKRARSTSEWSMVGLADALQVSKGERAKGMKGMVSPLWSQALSGQRHVYGVMSEFCLAFNQNASTEEDVSMEASMQSYSAWLRMLATRPMCPQRVLPSS